MYLIKGDIIQYVFDDVHATIYIEEECVYIDRRECASCLNITCFSRAMCSF